MAQCERICMQCGRLWFSLWVRVIPWRRKWQPTPVYLPGKSHGQRSLAGYSPWGHKRVRPSNQTAIQLVGGSIEQSVFSHKQVFAWIFFSSNSSSLAVPCQRGWAGRVLEKLALNTQELFWNLSASCVSLSC